MEAIFRDARTSLRGGARDVGGFLGFDIAPGALMNDALASQWCHTCMSPARIQANNVIEALAIERHWTKSISYSMPIISISLYSPLTEMSIDKIKMSARARGCW